MMHDGVGRGISMQTFKPYTEEEAKETKRQKTKALLHHSVDGDEARAKSHWCDSQQVFIVINIGSH